MVFNLESKCCSLLSPEMQNLQVMLLYINLSLFIMVTIYLDRILSRFSTFSLYILHFTPWLFLIHLNNYSFSMVNLLILLERSICGIFSQHSSIILHVLQLMITFLNFSQLWQALLILGYGSHSVSIYRHYLRFGVFLIFLALFLSTMIFPICLLFIK